MKNRKTAVFAAAVLSTLAALPTAWADPASAEEDAYNMTASIRMGVGYSWAPAASRMLGTGNTEWLQIEVVAGVFYNISAGVDSKVRNFDLGVYSEQMTLIKEDNRDLRRAGVTFKSTYTGSVYVLAKMVRTDSVGSYCLMVGKRGTPNENPAPPVSAVNVAPGSTSPSR